MIEEKELQVDQYSQLTKTLLHALSAEKETDVLELLGQRDRCIATIDRIDQEAGQILMNEGIKQKLTELVVLEQKLQDILMREFRKMSNLIRSVNNEKFLTKQYSETPLVSKGVFYDKKK